MGPKKAKPPRIESRVRKGWIFIPLSTNIDPKYSSINSTEAAPHINIPTAANGLPMKKYKNAVAGKTMIIGPKAGKTEKTAATVPHKIGFGTEKIIKPKAITIP